MLTKYTGSATDVVIPETVTSIADSVFEGNSVIKTVVIPDTVTAIGDNSFNNCANLESITLSKKLVSMGKRAFGNNPKLSYVSEIPATLKSVYSSFFNPERAIFANTPKLTTVAISNELTAIPGYLFCNSNITSIVIPDSVTEIGSCAFMDCKSLSSVKLSNALYKVGDNIFRNCSALTEIKLPSSLVEIGEYAFADTGLTSVSIPKPMRNLGERMFENCTALASVTLAPKQAKMNYAFVNCTALTDLTIPDTVTEANEPFAGSGLKNVTFVNEKGGASARTSIPRSMFNKAKVLESIELPETVTTISDHVFYGASALKDIKLPDGLLPLVSTHLKYALPWKR